MAKIESRYTPDYTAVVQGYEIRGSREGVPKALELMKDMMPSADRNFIKQLILQLIAKTRRREMPENADRLFVGSMIGVAREFPAPIIEEVVTNWHKRDGNEAIFTPTAAEFYRALMDAAMPFRLLVSKLEAIASNSEGEAVDDVWVA